MRGWSPLHQEIKPREGTVYVGKQPHEKGYVEGDEYKMSNEPMYEKHQPSSHLMADDGNKTAWPTLFEVDGVWYDIRNEDTERQMEIAEQQGELYTFNTTEEMIDFARKGNWKNK